MTPNPNFVDFIFDRDDDFSDASIDHDIVFTATYSPIAAFGRAGDGRPWAFKATGDMWVFQIAASRHADPRQVSQQEDGWVRDGMLHSAGTMNPADAVGLIQDQLHIYEHSRRSFRYASARLKEAI